MNLDPDKIIEAAKALVRAQWEFRCGPNAYRDSTAEWACQTEADLYEALTGQRDLTKAGRVLGKGIIKGRKPLKG